MIGLIGLKLQFGEGWWTSVYFLAFWITGTSLLMVSAIPMKKIHTVAVPPNLAARCWRCWRSWRPPRSWRPTS
ncbi:putative cDP-diacylglycerol--serine O-phosphatidyltransferase [Mycobacterium kansasii]|nr:putative cDP-diacylglycerol--serine O-phosphatidyltransferase [Mycobacterium kansasii]